MVQAKRPWLGGQRRWRFRLVAVVVLLALLALAAGGNRQVPVVEAHAYLVRSEPNANSIFPDTPPALQLWFSEEPELRFTEVAIYNTARVRVQAVSLQLAPEDRRSIVGRLDPLPPGVYTVVWKALSAVDGHTTAGAFAFGVGIGQEVTGPVTGLVAEAGRTTRPTPLDVSLRWLGYLAMAGLLGAVAFPPLVLEPALRRLRGQTRGAALPEAMAAQDEKAAVTGRKRGERRRQSAGRPATGPAPGLVLWVDAVRLAVTQRVVTTAWAAYWLAVAATLAGAVVQAARAANVSLVEALSLAPDAPLPSLLLGTRYGQVWLGRMLLLALTGMALTGLRANRALPPARARAVWLVAAALAAFVALTTSLNSHAAALAPGAAAGAPLVPIAANWLHLLAMALWAGGLIQLAVALPAGMSAAGPGRQSLLLATVIGQFTLVAVAAVWVLALSGTYQAVLHVGSVAALFGTEYGQALVAKLALLAPLLLLGAFNGFIARPRLARAVGRGPTAVGRRQSAAGSRGGIARPAPSGLLGAFRVAVSAEAVLASGILLATGVMAVSQPARDAWAELTRGVTLEQRAQDLRLQLRVNPATPGFNAFSLRVQDRNGRPVERAEKVALILSHLEHDMGVSEVVLEPQGNGVYLAETGVASMAGNWRAEVLVRRSGQDDVRSVFAFAVEDPVVAGGQAGQAGPAYSGTPVAPAAARQLRNPVPPTEESLAIGRQIYVQNCLVCHGVQGRGDGPAARTLRPPPADLATHVTQHTEGELWWWITNGVPGTQMPAWREVLTDVERWHVLNYIREAFGRKD